MCAFANDFQNLDGGYVVIGQGCDANGQPVFPPVGLAENPLDKIQRELLAYWQLIQPPYFPVLSIEEIKDRKRIVLWAPGGLTRLYKAPEVVCAQVLLHPSLKQHGRGQGRHRTGVVQAGGQGVVQ